MRRLSELFTIFYGNGFELNRLTLDNTGINFISRTGKNNGIAARVQRFPDLRPFEPGLITVSLGGSVLEAFLQTSEFYTAYHVFCLRPKSNLTEKEKLYYCICIRANKYRYNYGRQANKTLGDILVPEITEIPGWIEKISVPFIKKTGSITKAYVELDISKWRAFTYGNVFKIENGYYNKKPPESIKGNLPFVGASEYNNGITSYHRLEDIKRYSKTGSTEDSDDLSKKVFKGNCITVANNGNSVASAFYQKSDFSCTHDINVLRLRNYEITKFIALFLCVLIGKEKYRWSYGRKWRPKRMPNSTIKLPVNKDNEPDFMFMENFMKSLPYSQSI